MRFEPSMPVSAVLTSLPTDEVVTSECPLCNMYLFIMYSFFEAALGHGLTWSLLAKIVLVISNRQRISYLKMITLMSAGPTQTPLVRQ